MSIFLKKRKKRKHLYWFLFVQLPVKHLEKIYTEGTNEGHNHLPVFNLTGNPWNCDDCAFLVPFQVRWGGGFERKWEFQFICLFRNYSLMCTVQPLILYLVVSLSWDKFVMTRVSVLLFITKICFFTEYDLLPVPTERIFKRDPVWGGEICRGPADYHVAGAKLL